MNSHDSLVSHGFSASAFEKRMAGLYGLVFERQVERIASHLDGATVVDLGAGSGFLTHRLQGIGFKATAVDISPCTFEFARCKYNVEVEQRDIYNSGFADKSFDCAVLKEVVYHLNFPRAISEIARITRNRAVILQGTMNPLLTFGRAVLRHREYERRPPNYYGDALLRAGWSISRFEYYDPLAIYLSGGVIGPVLCPPSPHVCRLVMACDRLLENLLSRTHLDWLFCARFLIVAKPPD